ncbi:MAG: DinB family protein [Saprospiraceae bacterium]|nr:DinB family protein [Saprospiraceae bacterium]
MVIRTIKELFLRDLDKLKKEISLYESESNMWIIDKNISNSGGNLCFHLIGNLKHFIGSQLGNTGYIRQRELEFSSKNIPRVQLLNEIDEVIEVVSRVLDSLSDQDFDKEYPLVVFKDKMTIGFFLIHLASHLNYHLGQINYHRRLLDV